MSNDGQDSQSQDSKNLVSQAVREAARQQQFLDVVDRDTATERFQAALKLGPLGVESVELSAALNRTLAEDVIASVDVPSFDRSNVDGFAIQAADTFGATEDDVRRVRLNAEVLHPGQAPVETVASGTATTIATGGMLPRGADAVVMVEHTDLDETVDPPELIIRRSVASGQALTFAGTDIAAGETVLRSGQRVSSREIGVLAALGLDRVSVYRRPKVAVISTGNEIIAPGQPMKPGAVYDSNAAIVSAAVAELGGDPVNFGAIPDNVSQLREAPKKCERSYSILEKRTCSK